MSYEKATEYVDRLNRDQFAGYHGWRLPTLEEAMSLMDPTKPKKSNADFNIDSLFDRKQREIWTSVWTSDRYRVSSAWVVGFSYGGCYSDGFKDGVCVRAVR